MKHLRLILSFLVLASVLNCKSTTPEPVATVETPTMSPSGGNYTSDQALTIGCATPGAAIYYTTDGTTPTTRSALYVVPIAVAGNGTNVTIRAIAVKAGMTDSSVASASYVISYSQVAQPTISPSGGSYTSDQSVALSCATPGAAIHFTTDGTMPSAGSQLYGGPLLVAGHGTNMTIRAIATKAGMENSREATGSFVITYPPVAQPLLSPAEGTYPSDQSVTINCTTQGAAIHYTTDGSVPMGSSTRYTAPIAVAGMGTRLTIRAIATAVGMTDSPIAAADYYIKILANYAFIALDGSPNDVVYDPSRGLAYVSNRTLNRIEVVKVQTHEVEPPIPVGGSPRGLAISPDGQKLLATIYDKWQMSVVDLGSRSQVAMIDLPAPAYPGPLRVDFDAAGTCIWRSATEGHAFGNAYILDLGPGTSTPLVATEAEMLRYAPSFDRTRFLLMFISARASVWSSSTQGSSPPVSIPGFSGGSWADWMNQGAITNSGEIVLLSRFQETRVYDRDFNYLGSTGGMAWGTFGPWNHLALVVPGDDETSTATVSLVDVGSIRIVDRIDLPERVGYGEYNFGGQPIFLTADAKQLFAVGQTGLYVIDTSTVTE